jgi:bifunctional oligoribonuclease and PAP phosphatase NrnA
MENPNISWQSTGRSLEEASSIILLSHVRPDGDAYGSSLGLAHTLRSLGKHVHVFNQDGLLPMYDFLPGSTIVQATPLSAPPADLIVSLDTSTKERLGPSFLSWGKSVDLNIDHHISNTLYASTNLIDPDQPATAALITDLIQQHGWPMTREAASNLFVGLSTDTGSFRYRGTSSTTFRQAADLVEAGADSAELSRHCYQSMSAERFALLRLAFHSLRTEQHHQLAYYTLTPDMFQESGAKPEDTEGIVETSLNVASVRLGALFEMKQDGSLKVSLRSKGEINVSRIASEFGGGGHPGAAGINFCSEGETHLQEVLTRLRLALTES